MLKKLIAPACGLALVLGAASGCDQKSGGSEGTPPPAGQNDEAMKKQYAEEAKTEITEKNAEEALKKLEADIQSESEN